MPRKEFRALADALIAFEARNALWGSISAWEDSVALWRASAFDQLDIRLEVLRLLSSV